MSSVLQEWSRAHDAVERLIFAAMMLAPSPLVAKALLAQRPVPREALVPEMAQRLVCWDGILDDAIAIDVCVLAESDRLAGDVATPEPPWKRRKP